MRAHGKGVGLSQVDAIRHSILKEESFTEGLTHIFLRVDWITVSEAQFKSSDTKHGLQPPARRQVDMKAKSKCPNRFWCGHY